MIMIVGQICSSRGRSGLSGLPGVVVVRCVCIFKCDVTDDEYTIYNVSSLMNYSYRRNYFSI